MRFREPVLLVVIVIGTLLLAVTLVRVQASGVEPRDDAWAKMPQHPAHVDHSHFFDGPFADGPAVTRACLECHEKEGQDFLHSSHWSWAGDEMVTEGSDEPLAIGKKNLINNFCISIEANWPACTTCHAGYGWEDASFDFNDVSNADCLICHDRTGTYRKAKGGAGRPDPSVDLLAVAQSVAVPDRTNCGMCHFNGGGGDAVKHGDLDQTMYFPTEDIDVHMGRWDFNCTDCHRSENHEISGKSLSLAVDDPFNLACTNCHSETPHRNQRLDSHVRSVACQTCHIPEYAVREATKMYWDWSEAGQDLDIDDPHEYLKIKGRFRFERQVVPEYLWFNGRSTRYLTGDTIDPSTETWLNPPLGDVSDPEARIWPFKIHRGKQIYDVVNRYFLLPKTYGPGGYWTEFDWDQASRLGAEATGLPYSGEYDFAPTAMFWPLSHMVAPKERALQCTDCHGVGGRMDWPALGYEGDPYERGSQRQTAEVASTPAGAVR